jgi:hypothetical protein
VSQPNTTFSYDPPEISSVNYTVGGGVQVSGSGVGGSGRRYLSESPYGQWSSNGFGACLGTYQIPGIFWQISLEPILGLRYVIQHQLVLLEQNCLQ